MNMRLLKLIYYLRVVHYLCSGLKKMQCKYRPPSIQLKITWRWWVAVPDSNFQVRDELCISPRSFTLSTYTIRSVLKSIFQCTWRIVIW
jgi:hypothetical protein